MTLATAAVALLLAAQPEVRAVRITTLDSRTALRVLTSEDVPAAVVSREGAEILVRFRARAVADLALPSAQKPLGALRLEREAAATLLRLEVPAELPFECTHEPGLMTVVLGELPSPAERGRLSPELYARLFPAGVAAEAGKAAEEAVPASAEHADGWSVGRFLLRPYANLSWVDADVLAFDSPTPVRTYYLQVGPGVTASTPFLSGTLAAEYEARLRFFSNIPEVSDTSHLAGLRLELPLGSRALVRLGDRFTRATLETNVVDPGREYFYDLSRYSFNEATLALRLELGPRFSADLDGGTRFARYDNPKPEAAGGLFGYDSRAARAGIGYDLGGSSRLVVSYTFDSVPPSADRALVESSGHQLSAGVNGDLGPLMTGTLSAGYRTQQSPRAEGESHSWSGFVAGASLRREIGRATAVDLQLSRSTQLSAYETNAYYVASSASLGLAFPLPFEVSGHGTLTVFRNDYPNLAAAIEAPRRDESFGWALGLARRIGRRLLARADYRRDKRSSNVPGLGVTTQGFVFQLTVEPASGGRP